jgi:hypothetical protein
MKRSGWLILLALAAACGAAVTTGAASGADRNPFNVDCDIGWQGCYRPMGWAPVDVNIASTLKEPFEGVLTVSVQQDEITAMRVTHRFVLTPDVPVWVPLAARLSFGVMECRAAIQDAHDRTVWENTYGLWNQQTGKQSLTAVMPGQLLIGVSGRMGFDFGLRHLSQGASATEPGRSSPPRRRGPRGGQAAPPDTAGGKVYVKERLQRRLPWDWAPYQSLDLLILCDPEWTALAPQQSEAIAQWVSGGGRLLVILGSHPLPRDHRLAKLLALEPGEARLVTLPENVLRAWGAEGRETASVAAWPLDRPPAWGWKTEDHGTGRPLFAWGPVGFGKAGVLAFDPTALGGAQGKNLAPFWVHHLALVLDSPTISQGPPGDEDDSDDGRAYLYAGGKPAMATDNVLVFLLDIPELRPISIVWVMLLLLGMAVVIGPVDYFILKRRDRLPLTWLTFTVYIVAFSLLAYFGVKALRSGNSQFRAATVIDCVDGSAGAWRCSYSGIFASESDDYRLSGLARGQWWSALAPSAGRGFYGGPQRSARSMISAQGDGGNLPTYLPISIWSMQCLMTEEVCGDVPLAADLRCSVHNLVNSPSANWMNISGTIENRSDTPIRGGTIRVHEDRILRFGAIPAHGRLAVEGSVGTGRSWATPDPESTDSSRSPWRSAPPISLSEGDLFHAEGSLNRTRAILDRLKQGAAVVCAEYEGAPLPYGLAGRSHDVLNRQWVRLLVIPKEGPTP